MKPNAEYKCEICEQQFTAKRSLRLHSDSVHEENKSYQCNICTKQFVSSGHLKTHIDNTHNKNKQKIIIIVIHAPNHFHLHNI